MRSKPPDLPSSLNFHFQRTTLSLPANMSTATQVLLLALLNFLCHNVHVEIPFCIVIVDCHCPYPCLVLALFNFCCQNVKTDHFKTKFCIVFVDCHCPHPCLSLPLVFFLSEQVTKYLQKFQNPNLLKLHILIPNSKIQWWLWLWMLFWIWPLHWSGLMKKNDGLWFFNFYEEFKWHRLGNVYIHYIFVKSMHIYLLHFCSNVMVRAGGGLVREDCLRLSREESVGDVIASQLPSTQCFQ